MSQKRFRLSPKEIEALDLTPKGNNMYYLNVHKREILKGLRGGNIENPMTRRRKEFKKTSQEESVDSNKLNINETNNSKILDYTGEVSIQDLDTAIEFFNVDLKLWEVERFICNSWDITSKEGKRTNYQVKVWLKKRIKDVEVIKEKLIEEMLEYSPKYPKIKYDKVIDPHALVLDPADIHLGKIASAFESKEEYNRQIAVKRVLEGVEGIIQKARGFPIEKIIFIGGNDILHVDTPKNTTTRGTHQDTDGMWYENFLMARRLLVDVLEICMSIAPVEFLYCPSNHDFMSGFMLCDSVYCWFNECDNITFDIDMAHRKYIRYGNNLIGVTHGDGAKEKELPLLMAEEAKREWGKTKHRYIYGHHTHHKTSKDYVGVTYEALRSPSGTDSWHHKKASNMLPKL